MKRLCAAALTVFGAMAACGYSGSATSGDASAIAEGGALDVAAQVDAELPIDAATDEAAANGNLLQVTALESTSSLDIDGEGTLGWIHWGAYAGMSAPGETVTKASLPNAIPSYTLTGTVGQVTDFGGYVTNFMWQPGTGTPISGSMDTSGVYLKGVAGDQPSFHLALTAGTAGQRLILYAGLHIASASLTVKLGDGSVATAMLSAGASGTGNAYARWGIDFRAAQPGTAMTIDYELLTKPSPDSNIELAAATLMAMP